MNGKLFRKGDIAVIAAALAVAAVIMLLRPDGGGKMTANVTVNGELVESIELSELKEEITLDIKTEPDTVIKANSSAIWFESADCPDKLCVMSGKLTKKGDTAVCLPARTVITLLGAEVDAVTY